MKTENDWVRRSQRVIRMVSELHRMGFQYLRIMPYKHPMAWRLAIGPKDCFSERNGAVLKDDAWDKAAVYSSADDNQYFNWQDAKSDTARSLAEKFVLRFPVIAEAGKGRDWEYAGWFAELVGTLEQGDLLPVTLWEHMKGKADQLDFLPIWSSLGNNIHYCDSAIATAELDANVLKFPLPPTKDEFLCFISPNLSVSIQLHSLSFLQMVQKLQYVAHQNSWLPLSLNTGSLQQPGTKGNNWDGHADMGSYGPLKTDQR